MSTIIVLITRVEEAKYLQGEGRGPLMCDMLYTNRIKAIPAAKAVFVLSFVLSELPSGVEPASPVPAGYSYCLDSNLL